MSEEEKSRFLFPFNVTPRADLPIDYRSYYHQPVDRVNSLLTQLEQNAGKIPPARIPHQWLYRSDAIPRRSPPPPGDP